MKEEKYHVTTQNRFYPDMSNVLVKKNILQWRQNLSTHLRITLPREMDNVVTARL